MIGKLLHYVLKFKVELENEDDDSHLNHVNSKYYDIKQLNATKIDSPSSFGMFHVNIASLYSHIDDLRQILSTLNYKFEIIGISEHKIRRDTIPPNNISIQGYNEFIFEPTDTSHGGTGFFIKDNIDFITRKDLQINSPGNFESTLLKFNYLKRKS